jgi:hypothetical protein
VALIRSIVRQALESGRQPVPEHLRMLDHVIVDRHHLDIVLQRHGTLFDPPDQRLLNCT